jgi:beta-glucosidase
MDLIDKLLAKMTIEEKVGQLNMATAGQVVTGPGGSGDVIQSVRDGNVGAILNLWGRDAVTAAQKVAVEETRLGVPLFFALDVLHGHRAIFPIPLGEAAAFDVRVWERTARAAAREAARDGVDMTFAPMLDIARDCRWGRIAESPGEDPFVAMEFARAKVRGFQGADLADPGSVAATAKHFCAGGAATAGREYAAVDVSERALRETYLLPFEAAVGAGCAAIMTAFNSVAGVPMTAHAALLRGYLRERLGFTGVVVSDYTAIAELIEHGVAADLVEAAAQALNAGVDMDMVSCAFLRLPEALRRGLVTQQAIDAAVRRVLALKQKLGLFDDPYRRCRADQSPPPRHIALDAARRSITLLSNKGALPIARAVRRIAVIGPLADASVEMLGPWSATGRAENCLTVFESLRAAMPECEIAHCEGVAIDGDDASGVAPARAAAEGADLVILCLGESAGMSGEAASRAAPTLPGRQRELAEAALATGTPVVAVLFSGRPLMISWLAESAQAVVAAWFLGDMAGAAIADVLTGRFNPTGRLPTTWPHEAGQIPIFYAQRSTGRPPDPANPFTSKYLDAPVEPLFHFGHGLSYSKVFLSNLIVETDVAPGAPVRISVDVANDGSFAVEETIFVFLHDRVARVALPLLTLKRWSKVLLEPGEAMSVDFTLAPEDFAFLDERLEPIVEPGDFDIFVGRSADRRNLLAAKIALRPTVAGRTRC